MDERLWGNLQDYIDLAVVYARLPIGDFFRLRLVCKDWNRLASDREFLEKSIQRAIPSPYFIMGGRQSNIWTTSIKASWLLYYESWARRWISTRLPPWDCEAGGLLCDGDMRFVFNVRTRVFHELPPPPDQPEASKRGPLVGILATGSAAGQYSFQVTLNDLIYFSDSGRWTLKPWNHVRGIYYTISRPTCSMYLLWWYNCTSGVNPNLLIYHLENGKWGFLNPRPEVESMVIYDVGAWQNRVFLFGLKLEHDLNPIITAWELQRSKEIRPGDEADWALFDQMPDNMCKWMVGSTKFKQELGKHEAIQMQTRFSGKYVLVYLCVGFGYVAERAVLYNFEQKKWEKVQLPGPHRLSSEQSLWLKGWDSWKGHRRLPDE